MRGLRTKESDNFLKFFDIVQRRAKEKNAVFFLKSGECEDIIFGGMELDTLFGWLVPIKLADEFEVKFLNDKNLDNFDRFLVWCEHEVVDGKLNIRFE